MNPIRKYKLRWLIIIVFIWITVGALTAFYEYFFLDNFPGVLHEPSMKNYNLTANIIAAGIWGLLGSLMFGVLELFVIANFLERKPFYLLVSIKILLYSVLLVVLNLTVSYVFNVIFSGRSWGDPEVLRDVVDFATGASFWHPMLPFLALVVVTLFVLQISQRFGQGDLERLVRGKYFDPKEEDRFFMFLDLKDSTRIGEDLGHQKFFMLLNDFFHDITDAILLSGGEIYQYVGDEVIISWTREVGSKDAQCLRCFFDICDSIANRTTYYESHYGLVPEFKAGCHFGSVTIGEIGKVKKSVTYSGDVLNTTSRVQHLCNEYSEKLIITGDLFEHLDPGKYVISALGPVELKGKSMVTEIFAVRRGSE